MYDKVIAGSQETSSEDTRAEPHTALVPYLLEYFELSEFPYFFFLNSY